MSAEQLGLVELPVPDLADAAHTVTGEWGGRAGGSYRWTACCRSL